MEITTICFVALLAAVLLAAMAAAYSLGVVNEARLVRQAIRDGEAYYLISHGPVYLYASPTKLLPRKKEESHDQD